MTMRHICFLILTLLWVNFSTVGVVRADTATDLFQKAAQLDKDGFLDEAARALEQVLKARPEKNLATLTRLRLSSIYIKLAEIFKAVEMGEALVLSRPDLFDAHFHLGNAQSKLKKFPEAIEAYKKTTELRPDEGLGYIALALAYFGNRNPDAAVEQLKTAKKIFKKKKNISWYRDSRIMVQQIRGFAPYPPNFSDLWLANNLELVRNTYEKNVFNPEGIKK
jgi:tetratricopeptide (TPR) repeat protein